MPAVNVSESDFQDVAFSAAAAQEAGYTDMAQRLDKLARKINAVLTAASTAELRSIAGMPKNTIRWQDMPSTLGEMP